ncbi:25741_t:CDS:1, partial [Racocetra persica]
IKISTIYPALIESNEETFINQTQLGNGAMRSLTALLITLIPDLTA